MSSLEYEIMSGKRRNSKVLYVKGENQLYIKKSESKGKKYYTCYKEDCKSRVILDNGQCRKPKNFIQHCHGEQGNYYSELKALNQIKDQCLDVSKTLSAANAVRGIRDNFRDVCVKNQESTKNIDFNKVKRGLQYLTSKVFSASPKTPTDVVNMFKKENIFQNFGLSLHEGQEKTPFFKICHDSNEFSYCIFGSDKIINLIKENIPNNKSKKILIDATFSIVPIGCFQQLLLVHIEYYEKVFPIFFILTNKKSTKCYTHLFNYINYNLLNLNDATFITDYEASLRRAIKASFLNAKLYGCWFHFCQAVRRQITLKYKNLAKFIRQDSRAALQYHKIISLPLLPATHIEGAFENIKTDVVKIDCDFKFSSFLTYFDKQWLKKIGPNNLSTFETSTRTTSAVEGYNGVLAKIIPKLGNFFKFVKILQTEEFNKSRDFELLVNSGGTLAGNKRRKKYIEKSELIERANEDLRSGRITASAFLNRLVFPQNKIVVEMEPEDDFFEEHKYLEEEEEDEDSELEPLTESRTQILCVICFAVEPNILFIPCKHLKVCNTCVLKLQAESISKGHDTYSCPICREKVNDVMQVFI